MEGRYLVECYRAGRRALQTVAASLADGVNCFCLPARIAGGRGAYQLVRLVDLQTGEVMARREMGALRELNDSYCPGAGRCPGRYSLVCGIKLQPPSGWLVPSRLFGT